jgi:hypothetical protein
MEKRMRLLLIPMLLFVSTAEVTAQFSENPPEPMAATTTDGRKGDCGKGDGGNGGGISPPVGLCLPINDYLVPLLLSGIALGSFSLWQKKQAEKIG